jgi:hypothetical protein
MFIKHASLSYGNLKCLKFSLSLQLGVAWLH